MKWDLTVVALAVLAVATVSRHLTGSAVTPTMLFVGLGLLLGPLVVDELKLDPASATVRTLAEATLAVVLFLDASRIKLRALRHEYAVPLRLLGIGLPLTIVLGTAAAVALFPQMTVAEALVLAVVLAPTDAALGEAVVSDERLPSRIRQGLNVESGLNDGICVPLLLVALAVADVESNQVGAHHAFTIVWEEIGYGILAGVAAGSLSAAATWIGTRRELIAGSWLQLIPPAAAALAYGTAAALGGSGFIAAFVAGLLFGGLVNPESEQASRFAEEGGELLGGVTFLVFGAVLLGAALEHMSWQVALYAALSLTLVRMLPVAVAMIGSGASMPTIGFLGWFGPRGLASIVFAVIVVQEAHLAATSTILVTTYCTIGISVLAHGASAAPLAVRYARWYESRIRDDLMEKVAAPGHRPRGPRALAAAAGRSASASEARARPPRPRPARPASPAPPDGG